MLSEYAANPFPNRPGRDLLGHFLCSREAGLFAQHRETKSMVSGLSTGSPASESPALESQWASRFRIVECWSFMARKGPWGTSLGIFHSLVLVDSKVDSATIPPRFDLSVSGRLPQCSNPRPTSPPPKFADALALGKKLECLSHFKWNEIGKKKEAKKNGIYEHV